MTFAVLALVAQTVASADTATFALMIGVNQSLDYVINIVFSVVFAKAEANRASRQFFVTAQRADYRRG